MKSHDKSYEDISITKGLSSDEMLRFSDILETQGENESVNEKIIPNEKEMCESINTKNISGTETEYASVEYPLIMHRTASNETTLVSEIPNIINKENVVMAPRQRKTSFNFK